MIDEEETMYYGVCKDCDATFDFRVRAIRHPLAIWLNFECPACCAQTTVSIWEEDDDE